MVKYNTGFKMVGSSYDETLLLLHEYNRLGSWDKVKEVAYSENLLKKRSRKWINSLLGYVRKRYLDPHPPLPSGKTLAKFVTISVPRQAKIQILYQYICESNPLVDRLMLGLIAPNIEQYGSFFLTKTTFYEFLDKESKSHPEIKNWAEITKRRWQSDYYAFLRHTGIMDTTPSVEVQKFVVRDEAFGFLIYGLVDSEVETAAILANPIFARFFLTRNDIEEKLAECQIRGWLHYQSAGGISELVPRYTTLEDWINALKP